MKRFYVNNKVYFYYDMIRQICSGTIKSFLYDSKLNMFIYKIAIDCGGEIDCLDKYVFISREECENYVKLNNNNVVNSYLKEINDKDDLVRFCFNHNVANGEYCDYEARLAAKIKADEFKIVGDFD